MTFFLVTKALSTALKGTPPLNSEKFMRRAVYHKEYVLNFVSEKQIIEAHSFDGLCRNGAIS